MVPEVQGGMLAPPFMDHRMTSELDLIGTNCRTHEFSHWTPHTLDRQRTQTDDLGLRLSHRTPRTLDTLCGGSQMPG